MGKKLLVLLCAAVLSMCCVGLAACGSSSGSGSGSASSASTNPTAKFIGDWKIAGGTSQGVTVVGDFSAMAGSELTFDISVKEDGTATMSSGDESFDCTWEADGDNAIKLTPTNDESGSASSASASSASASSTIDALGNIFDTLTGRSDNSSEGSDASAETNSIVLTYIAEDDALSLPIEDNGVSGEIIFSKDGTLASAPVIDTSAATDFTSASELEGEWKLSGATMFGMSMYGDMEALAAQTGGSLEGTLTFQPGGTVQFMGSDATWAVGENGATITVGGMLNMSMKKLGDQLVLDMGSALGMDMVFLYSK